MTELSPFLSCFRDHHGLLISHQWISGCRDMWNPECISFIRKLYLILNDAIRTAIQEIPIPMVCAAVLSTICRMQSVIVCEGGYVGKFVKHNKTLYFMLILCPSWLSSLLAYLALVIFVLQLPFERYLGFLQWRSHSNTKNWVLPFEIFEIFSL